MTGSTGGISFIGAADLLQSTDDGRVRFGQMVTDGLESVLIGDEGQTDDFTVRVGVRIGSAGDGTGSFIGHLFQRSLLGAFDAIFRFETVGIKLIRIRMNRFFLL